MADFSDRFRQRVAVNFRCPFVPIRNSIVCIANDDRIVAQIQQPRLLGQLLFVTFALRQIDDGGLVEQSAISRGRGNLRTQKLHWDPLAFSRFQL